MLVYISQGCVCLTGGCVTTPACWASSSRRASREQRSPTLLITLWAVLWVSSLPCHIHSSIFPFPLPFCSLPPFHLSFSLPTTSSFPITFLSYTFHLLINSLHPLHFSTLSPFVCIQFLPFPPINYPSTHPTVYTKSQSPLVPFLHSISIPFLPFHYHSTQILYHSTHSHLPFHHDYASKPTLLLFSHPLSLTFIHLRPQVRTCLRVSLRRCWRRCPRR